MTELTLREIRLKTGMTVKEMAEELNVPRSSYEYWESKNKFTEETIIAWGYLPSVYKEVAE